MGDAENSLQPSKKRSALKELSRDNPGLDDDDNETSEQETGTFKRASDEVMASRRIVKVRRDQTASAATAPCSNPFAGIRLVPPSGTKIPAALGTSEDGSVATTSSKLGEKNDSSASREFGNGTTTSGKLEETNDPSEATKKEETDVNKEAEKETDENSKLPKNKFDEPKAESNVDQEKVDDPNEQKKPESSEQKAAESEKIENDTKAGTVVEKSENEIEKDVENNKPENGRESDVVSEKNEKGAETASFSSFQQLSSSQNAFTGLAGTGFSNTTFSFGAISKEGSPLGFGSESGSGSVFGVKSDQSSFGLSLPTNGNLSLFGKPGSSTENEGEGTGFPSMQEVPVETGEENEKPVFTADSVLFEFLDGGWKERGKGELKVNAPSTGTGKARLVMRTRGNYRLILNANLYPEMKLTNMDKRGVSFACMNSAGDGKDGLSTIALKFKDASIVDAFRATVLEHKDKTTGPLKTPENSPKTSDD